MDRNVLIVLGVVVALLLVAGLDGKVTGNAFAWNLPRSCAETDGGNDPYEQGEVEYKGLSFAGPKRTATDTCINAANLLEHYCDDAVYLTETVPCKCEEGACVR